MDGGAWWAAVHGTRLSNFTFTHWRRKWQPTPVFLHGESQGWRSLGGCHLWGRTVSHWSDFAAATEEWMGGTHSPTLTSTATQGYLLYISGFQVRTSLFSDLKKKKKRKQLGIQEGSKFLWFFLPYNHLCKRHPKMWVLDGVYCEHCNTEHSAIKSCWN